MAAIDEAAQMIRTRLDELNSEKEKLERALGELGAGSRPRRGRPPGRRKPGPKPGPRKASTARIPRAEREQAILVFLKDHPSASAKEIGAGVGTNADYVNDLLTGLRKQGRLVRKADGTQVEVKAGAASSAAAKPAAAKSATRKKPGRKKGSGKKNSGSGKRANNSAGKAAVRSVGK